MASFYEDFSGNLSNWIISSAAPVDRLWWTDSGLLKVDDSVSGKFGLIRYDTPIDVNGNIVVEYNGVDPYNGDDNLIVFRYTDLDHFNFISIQPGQNDDRGVGLGFDELTQFPPISFDMYNINGDPLSGEVAPNKTIIPVTGKVELNFTGNVYDTVLYTTLDVFVASGTYTDTANNNINAGYVGFGHDDKWAANINGWDSISATDFAAIGLPPTIVSFSATDYDVNLGDSIDLGWVVTSGTEPTTVYLAPINTIVPLEGTYLETPSVSAVYSLSAWNSVGFDYEEFVITINDTFPEIQDFSNDGPISAGDTSNLSWTISGGTSAFIDNGIGWVTPVSAGTVETPALYADSTYNIIAYDEELDSSTSATTVDVQQLPTANIYVSGSPVCSGSTYAVIWDTSDADSVSINGTPVTSAGEFIVTATVPINYNLSAVNSIGITLETVNAIVYYRDPIPYAGDDVSVNSPDGSPVAVTLDGTQSYDPDGLPLEYEWYDGSTLLSTASSFIHDYSVGVHTVDMITTDQCTHSAADSVNVNVYSSIPPVAIGTANPSILSAPGSITLNGSQSYDPDGSITQYLWLYQGNIIGTTVQTTYNLPSYGTYLFTLRVTDNDGLQDETIVSVTVSTDVLPVADAGEDQSFCTSSTVDIFLDGSGSTAPDGSELDLYSWNLSDFGVPNVSGAVNNVTDISATVSGVDVGSYNALLTVYADNGFSDSDYIQVNVYPTPSIIAPDIEETLAFEETVTDIQLSAYSNVSNADYFWEIYVSSDTTPELAYDQFVDVNSVSKGHYFADVQSTNVDTGCVSEKLRVNIDILSDELLNIVDFTVTPSTKFIVGESTDVELYWDVDGATEVAIDVLGVVDPVSGTSPYTVNYPGGMVPFTIVATDGVNSVSQTIYGRYTFINQPAPQPTPGNPDPQPTPNAIQICKDREEIVKTYGVDELKYGTDRYINLVDYLPDYVRGTDTELLLEKFEFYLNEMFGDQRNYTWGEEELDVRICDTAECQRLTCCNDINPCQTSCSGDCTNECLTTDNQYTFVAQLPEGLTSIVAETPAESVGELFISDICDVKTDKISMLDKIFRLTELFDPDLIPIELIQFYAENLGYQAGISRNAITASREDPIAREIEQKRYLRFMVRNLPNWYQIKTTRSSIAIMLYSFGLIGDFVYYYTKLYSDANDPTDIGFAGFGCDGESGDENDLCTVINPDSVSAYSIADNRCCLEKYLSNLENWKKGTNESNGLAFDDWILTDVDQTSLQEDLTPIPKDQGYFSSPHFKLWINLDESTGNYSTDEDRQRMIKIAVDAVKPLNTVFDGVAVYWDGSPVVMYMRPLTRIRRYTKISATGGTYINPDHPLFS